MSIFICLVILLLAAFSFRFVVKRNGDSSSGINVSQTAINMYSFAQFKKLQKFRGKLIFKDLETYESQGATNYVYMVIIEMVDTECAVADNPGTEQTYNIIANLETNKFYDFPNVLEVNSTRQP